MDLPSSERQHALTLYRPQLAPQGCALTGRMPQRQWQGELHTSHYLLCSEVVSKLVVKAPTRTMAVQYRRAIRHPQPAEREYLAAQSTGTGVHVGGHVQGGWLVDAAMAESPAEEAGILRGDRIIEISMAGFLSLLFSAYPATICISQVCPLEGSFPDLALHLQPSPRAPPQSARPLPPSGWPTGATLSK